MGTLNYARMPGAGDFSPRDTVEHDDTDIRGLLSSSPDFVEEAIGDETDWRAVAQAVIDRDAMELLRLFDVAVKKYTDWHIEKADAEFTPPQCGDDPATPYSELERAYGEHLRKTARAPLDMRAYANGLIGGVRS